MKRKIIFSLLLISLAFNVAFISVFVYHRLVVRRMMTHIGPPPEHCREGFKENMLHLRPLKQNFHKQKEAFLRDLIKKDFVKDEALRKLDETLKQQMFMEREIGERMIKLRSEMTHEEAVKFFKSRAFKQNLRKRRRGQ